jgi:polyadenylate-binding protein
MAPPDQKQYLGEALYQQVQILEPESTGKVTGMLLEVGTEELLHLLEDPNALRTRVEEAQRILRDAAAHKPSVG